jgi:hypothetical protein
MSDSRHANFQIKAKALDFVHKELKGTALVGSGRGPVFLKLDDWLKADHSGGDLWLKDPDKIGGSGFCEVNDDWLWGDGSVSLFTNSFSEGGAGKTLF